MRKQLCIGVLATSFLVSMLAGATASAKSVNNVRAQIPFDFYVGGKLVGAGDCRIDAVTADEATLRISGDGGSAIVNTMSKQAKQGSEPRPRLVFHKYGDQYFLAAVWSDDSTGRLLLESKRERNLRKELVAARGGAEAMEVVTVAAR